MTINSLKNNDKLNSFKVSKSLTFLFFSLIIVTLLNPGKRSDFDGTLNITLTFIILLNVNVFFNRLRKIYFSWIRYDTLFILGFLIVHFQIPFLSSMGIEPYRPDLVWSDKNVVNFATWFSSMGLLLWMAGFYGYLNRNIKSFTYAPSKYHVKSIPLKILVIVFFLLFIFLVGDNFLSGSYSGTRNWGTGATYVFSFLQYFFFLNIFYFFQKNQGKFKIKLSFLKIVTQNIIFISITITYLIIFLMVGDRGTVLQIGLMIVGAYSIYQKKISLKNFLFFAILGAFLFFIISFGRTRDVSSRNGNIISEGIKKFQQSDRHINPTGELARSVRVLYQALDVVPDEHPHLYGLTLAFNLIDTLPFGGRIYINVTNLPMMYTSSTYFFTILKKGENFRSGVGTEIIADLYINFGVWPTLMVFLFFGYIISYFSYRAFYKKNHYHVLVYLILITTSIYVSRSIFLIPIKTIVWTLLFDKFLTKKVVAK